MLYHNKDSKSTNSLATEQFSAFTFLGWRWEPVGAWSGFPDLSSDVGGNEEWSEVMAEEEPLEIVEFSVLNWRNNQGTLPPP
ncbi:hypothetical protein [Mycoplasma wenyonii]|uniref:hypothetical protein n=1 Tax=Mycoplasma wenyonii TaxID=65123 RepID=UPI0011BD026D|nr:hypothetical protein [Mycoplasma wenyonii]